MLGVFRLVRPVLTPFGQHHQQPPTLGTRPKLATFWATHWANIVAMVPYQTITKRLLQPRKYSSKSASKNALE